MPVLISKGHQPAQASSGQLYSSSNSHSQAQPPEPKPHSSHTSALAQAQAPVAGEPLRRHTTPRHQLLEQVKHMPSKVNCERLHLQLSLRCCRKPAALR